MYGTWAARKSNTLAWWFLSSVGLMWEEDEAASLEYFLNSVEELDFDGERIRFSGVCSPVVRG